MSVCPMGKEGQSHLELGGAGPDSLYSQRGPPLPSTMLGSLHLEI